MEENEGLWEQQIRAVNENNPFMRHNGIRAIFLDGERAQVAVQAADFSRNAMGSIHGGLFFLMGETAAGLLVRSDGRRYVTLDVSFRYLRASVGERELQAEAVWIRRGRSVTVCRALIREKGSEKALAEGEFSFFCLDAGSGEDTKIQTKTEKRRRI